jgi:hypothetical protein
MHFHINDDQTKKVIAWLKDEYKKIVSEQIGTDLEKHHFTLDDVTYPYFDGCDGGLTYAFSPTYIGEYCVAYLRKGTDKEVSIDLTEYEKW